MSRYPTLAASLWLMISSCTQKDPQLWADAVRTQILTASALEADTSFHEFLADSAFSHRTFIHQGHVFREEWYGKQGDLQGVSYFTQDGKYELRREICPDGQPGFEGILYKNKFYGPCTWWFCSGQIRQQGFRYANREIGTWRRWDESGRLVDEVARGAISLLDSLPE